MIHTDGVPTIASRVQAAREEAFKNQETLSLAVELAATLGFCQGFLGRDRSEFAAILNDFPEEYEAEMLSAYLGEYAEGQSFLEIPISELHPDNPFS